MDNTAFRLQAGCRVLQKGVSDSADFHGTGYACHALSANYSPIHPFTITSVPSNTPVGSKVYRLYLAGNAIKYLPGCYQTYYIGSARNQRNRSLNKPESDSHNDGEKEFINGKGRAFRYVNLSRDW